MTGSEIEQYKIENNVRLWTWGFQKEIRKKDTEERDLMKPVDEYFKEEHYYGR